MDAFPFRTWLYTADEAALLSRRCTRLEMERLLNSGEFRRWKRAKWIKRQLPLLLASVLLFLVALGCLRLISTSYAHNGALTTANPSEGVSLPSHACPVNGFQENLLRMKVEEARRLKEKAGHGAVRADSHQENGQRKGGYGSIKQPTGFAWAWTAILMSGLAIGALIQRLAAARSAMEQLQAANRSLKSELEAARQAALENENRKSRRLQASLEAAARERRENLQKKDLIIEGLKLKCRGLEGDLAHKESDLNRANMAIADSEAKITSLREQAKENNGGTTSGGGNILLADFGKRQCVFYKRGECKYGSACKFRHD